MTDTDTQTDLITDAELDDLLGIAEPAPAEEKEPPMNPEEAELAAVVEEVVNDEAPQAGEPEPAAEEVVAVEDDEVNDLISDVLGESERPEAETQGPDAADEQTELAQKQEAERQEILEAGKAKFNEHLGQMAREEQVADSAGEFGAPGKPGKPDADLEPKVRPPALRLSPSQLQEDLKISRADVDVSMRDQAGLYGHYAQISMRAGLSADRKKSELEILEAQVDEELRNKAADEGVKITEASLAKKILLDSRVQAKRYELNKAKAEAALAKEALEALKMRRDMLVQIGKDRREEMLGDVRVQAHDSRMGALKDDALKKMGGRG